MQIGAHAAPGFQSLLRASGWVQKIEFQQHIREWDFTSHTVRFGFGDRQVD